MFDSGNRYKQYIALRLVGVAALFGASPCVQEGRFYFYHCKVFKIPDITTWRSYCWLCLTNQHEKNAAA